MWLATLTVYTRNKKILYDILNSFIIISAMYVTLYAIYVLKKEVATYVLVALKRLNS